MTKPRLPVTFDNALTAIAAQIGWPAMAGTVGQAERTVRDWGDPDTGRDVPIRSAVALDIAFQKAGGVGAPMLDTYTLLVERAREEAFFCQIELHRRTIEVIREGSEAEVALLMATLPDADEQTRRAAAREVEQNISALKRTLPLLIDEDPP